MKPAHSIREDCKALRQELKWHQNSIHGWRIESRATEKLLKFVQNELNYKKRKFDSLTRSVDEREQRLQYVQHELNAKKRECDFVTGLIKERNYEVDEKEKRLREKARDIENQYKHIKSKQQEIEEREKDLRSKEERFLEQEKAHDGKVKCLESKFVELQKLESRIQIQCKEQEEKFEERKKDLRSKEEQFVEQQKAHEGKVECLESKFVEMQELESILEEREKVLRSNEEDYDKQLDVLIWEEKKLEPREKHLETKEKQSEIRETFNLVKQLESICSQVSAVLRASSDPAKLVLDAIKVFCPSHVRNLLVNELYKTSPVISFHVKEEAIKFATEWKANLSVLAKDNLEVLNYFKFVATYKIGSSCQAPQVLCGPLKLSGNQPSLTTNDGGNFQLLSDGPELNDNGISVNLQTEPNPAQLVLDIIRNPMIRRDEGIIIEKSQIFLLGQLMRISPHIDPEVKYKAMKLALELKETVNESAENSLVVLGFLLLLSSYGLFPHSNFNEDEVLKLFELVAHHKEAVELFRTLGFVDKIYDFVDNLIKNRRHIGAVRFISAYNLADKSRLVSIMLQIEMHQAKQISFQPKVKARDTEIAILRDILQCISDCNLEYLHNLVGVIKKRILVLEQENQRENSVSIASDSHSKEKKRARNTVSMNQVKEQELSQKKPYDVAGTKNQVGVQNREEKQPQVEIRQSQVRKHVDEQEDYQLSHQFGNIKRLRTNVASSSNLVPHYNQHAFITTCEIPAAQFANPNHAVLFRNEEGKPFQHFGPRW